MDGKYRFFFVSSIDLFLEYWQQFVFNLSKLFIKENPFLFSVKMWLLIVVVFTAEHSGLLLLTFKKLKLGSFQKKHFIPLPEVKNVLTLRAHDGGPFPRVH